LPNFLNAQTEGWKQISIDTKMEFDGIYFFNELDGMIGGGGGNTYTTTDGGETWNRTSSQGFRDYDFYDDTYGFGASIVAQSMGYSSSGGDSWTRITPPTSNSLWAVAATGKSSAYFSGTGGVLWKTENAGASVKVLNTGSFDLITDIHFFDDETGILVFQLEGILKTTNGGLSISKVYANSSEKVTFTEMHFINDSVGFVLGYDLNNGSFVLKTTDKGDSWVKIKVSEDSEYLYGIDFYNEQYGLVVGNKGDIYYTNNGGETWNRQLGDKDSTDLTDVHMFSESSAIIIGDDGMVLLNNSIKIINSVEETAALNFRVFPNPTTSSFTVQSKDVISGLQLMDCNGRVLMVVDAKGIKGEEMHIDIAKLDRGVYFLVATKKSKKMVTKVIKN
jgi:photosystem II stability/assembly factor-like uncharacterized protein